MRRALSDRSTPLVFACACALVAPACVSTEWKAQAGYTSTAVSGELSLTEAGGTSSTPQDIESTFGLGNEQGSAYGRVDADFGTAEFTGSLFWLRESGRGVLSDTFGQLPPGTDVTTDLDLGVAKFVAAAGFDVGPVTIAPGVLIDVFSIDFRATATQFGGREEVDEVVAVPMPFLRAGAAFGDFSLVGEIAWLDTPGFVETEGVFFDAEVMVEWRVWRELFLTTGYRAIGADAEGDSGDDTLAIDFEVRGFYVGAGLSF